MEPSCDAFIQDSTHTIAQDPTHKPTEQAAAVMLVASLDKYFTLARQMAKDTFRITYSTHPNTPTANGGTVEDMSSSSTSTRLPSAAPDTIIAGTKDAE